MAPGGNSQVYRGRFAPSPTGPLHFGSLIAAMASYLQARSHGGSWLVRIEDIDPPRELPGADHDILASLAAHGFEWDEEPLWQSTRQEIYDAALTDLLQRDLGFICRCSRKQLQKQARTGPLGLIYPGTCSTKHYPADTSRALRLRCPADPTSFSDLLQGDQRLDLRQELGDYLLRRGDGRVAYHLAVTVDDALQGITEVVRGSDLLLSTHCHIHLQRQLNYSTPGYVHVPVATDESGTKLSKQAHAAALDSDDARLNLLRGLRFLGQNPPNTLKTTSIAGIWRWATENWSLTPLKGQREKPEIGHFGLNIRT
jgi:glutamyl-Q tRNA(Asp) synthetase